MIYLFLCLGASFEVWTGGYGCPNNHVAVLVCVGITQCQDISGIKVMNAWLERIVPFYILHHVDSLSVKFFQVDYTYFDVCLISVAT